MKASFKTTNSEEDNMKHLAKYLDSNLKEIIHPNLPQYLESDYSVQVFTL